MILSDYGLHARLPSETEFLIGFLAPVFQVASMKITTCEIANVY